VPTRIFIFVFRVYVVGKYSYKPRMDTNKHE